LESVIFFCLAIMVKININIPLYQTASREKVRWEGWKPVFVKQRIHIAWYLVDVPLVPAEELAALIRQSLHSDAKAVILSHGGHEEPLMGVYCTDLADAMLEEITERKGAVFAFLRKNGYECYESQVPDRYFSNINDPEMYSKIQTTAMSLKK
jgi:CTP:molybdopterin cytidylyltransferase MocA